MPTVRIEAEVDGLNEATHQVNNLNNALGAFPKMTRMELEALGKFIKEVDDFLERTSQAELGAFKATLSNLERIEFERDQQIAAIIKEQQEIEKLFQSLGGLREAQSEAASELLEKVKRESVEAEAAIHAGAQVKITAENIKTFQEMSKTIDTFVDRWGKGAQNLGVVWDRMQNEIALGFSKFIFRMIGEWDFALKAMQAISSRGLSGMLFAPFEKLIFGRGGGNAALAASGAIAGTSAGVAALSGVISTPPFNPNATGLGIDPAGQAVLNAQFAPAFSGAGIPPALGGATQGAPGALAFGGIGALLKNPGFLATAIGGGLTAGGLGLLFGRSPVRGALGGVLTATGILTMANVLLTGVTAAATLGLSAAAGVLIASIMRGRAKRRAAGIEEEFIRQGQEIVERYKEFEMQFGPAIAQLEALKAQGMDTLLGAGLGRAGRRGAQNLGSNMDVLLREVERIERQREQRRMLLGGFALPEFMFGGPVRGINAANGALLAMLHPGEFVLRKEAVQAMGESALATLNSSPQTAVSAPGFAAPARPITVNFNISAVDGASVARFWRQSRPQIVKAIRKAIGDRAL